jgi:indolepyruvate decarboxylase
VGDGAFQMTGMELSTIVRYGLNPIIIVLNNLGYGTERPMQDGKFNDILLWNYSQFPQLLNSGKGFDIWTEYDLKLALEEAKTYEKSFCLLDVHLDPQESSLALQRLTKALKDKI